MGMRRFSLWGIQLLVAMLLVAGSAWGQFTASIQGTVVDQSGAAVAQAKVDLVNTVTKVSASTKTDASGSYRFLSLAPGSYTITVDGSGFSKSETNFTLETNENLNLPISLKVGAASASVVVTAEPPLLNTAETRNQQTLEAQELSTLPLAGRNMLGLISVAPGVSGLGLAGGPGVSSGTPGSGVDVFSTETAADISANGQGTVANMWIIDSLDVTSNIRQGVLNLVPNPDVVQETTIQVNTFSSEYGRGSGLQTTLTTKSGTDTFHGLASDYFYNQHMYAKYSLPNSVGYLPFHGNNISGTIGGPIIPHHQFFFFFGVEPLRASYAVVSPLIFPDPAFAAWANTNQAGTFGAKILNQYVPTHISGTTVFETADKYFGPDPNDIPQHRPICQTNPAAIDNIPCSLAMLDSGTFGGTNFRNGTQYFGRVDKYFKNDRVYGSFFRTLLGYGGPPAIPQFNTTNNTWERAFQVNWAHTFSPTLLNEGIFAQNRIEGKLNETGDFSIPGITVNGGQNLGYGLGFSQGDFIQHNYHWRDVLTKIRGAHAFKVGYEGWFGDDVEPFQGPWSHPSFTFDNLLRLAQDAPATEGGVMYSPTTGQQQLWDWNAASKTWGLFAEDTWKARRNLTLTVGFRFDDQGNPYSRSTSTVFGNFYLGTGSTFDQRVASGFAKPTQNAVNHAPKAYTPRIGAAWDMTGKGDWVLRGGFGMYSNWLTPANIQEEFRGNPPGLILPGFVPTNAPGNRPVFVQGTSNKPPWGFTFPALAGTPLCPTAPCLDAAGGIVKGNLSIGGIDPNIISPTAYIFATTIEHKLTGHLVASVLYSGSHTSNLVGNGNLGGLVSYGVDINAHAGDLIGTPRNTSPARLNPSFGSIAYTQNDRVANYNGLTFDLRSRVGRGFFDASYTRSSSKDDASRFPTATNPHRYYGPSPWDAPNRFSLSFNYELPGLNSSQAFVRRSTGGWGVSGTSIYQSGYPFTVFTSATFWNGGDYNADGDTFDYPNATNYQQATSRSAYLSGVFSSGQFTAPTQGTEGNEKPGQFRNPAFIQADTTVYKNTHITERLNFQIRFEFFNLFNHPNFQNIQGDLSAGNFGQVTGQTLPRWWQIGGKLTF